ncbi:amidase [Lampropedia cohaerens]|uniref:Amidase n=1 Tax=Lampropedia cohaerens TaxID=1610491 RepID=A0A0U1Q310_9BURK|nr:amidase [Lampropedia cohaerens]KKW69126.1 amidase [Lampropedia cohaerens]
MSDNVFCFIPYPPVEVPHAAHGPLAGVRMAVKDIYDVAGYPSSWGNPHVLAMSGIKTRTAPAIAALLAAGAQMVGKTVTDELAFSMTGKNAHFGMPRNGAAPDRIPGGSSSGSASAVANGLCDLAIGSDTGGSVRCPASHNGILGIRPTHGRIALDGCMALAPSLDTLGWFARDMDVFAAVADVLLGEDSAPLPATPRLLVAQDVLATLDAAVGDAFATQLAQLCTHLGVSAQPVDAWLMPPEQLYWAFRFIQGYEAWQSHGALIAHYGLQLGPGVRERFEWSRGISASDVEPHHRLRVEFSRAIDALLGQDGVLLMPTMPQVAPLAASDDAAHEDYRNQSIRQLCVAGLAKLPQISLPVMAIEGVPLGLSLIGPRGSDRSLVKLAKRIYH